MAYIKADGKRQHLGYFKTLEEAYTAYCKASKRLHGEYAPQRIKDMNVDDENLEPQQKIYKSPKWAIENYNKNKPVKQRLQVLRNIKKNGNRPKKSTIEKHNLTEAEIQKALTKKKKKKKYSGQVKIILKFSRRRILKLFSY
jgi:hypothetical protein